MSLAFLTVSLLGFYMLRETSLPFFLTEVWINLYRYGRNFEKLLGDQHPLSDTAVQICYTWDIFSVE